MAVARSPSEDRLRVQQSFVRVVQVIVIEERDNLLGQRGNAPRLRELRRGGGPEGLLPPQLEDPDLVIGPCVIGYAVHFSFLPPIVESREPATSDGVPWAGGVADVVGSLVVKVLGADMVKGREQGVRVGQKVVWRRPNVGPDDSQSERREIRGVDEVDRVRIPRRPQNVSDPAVKLRIGDDGGAGVAVFPSRPEIHETGNQVFMGRRVTLYAKRPHVHKQRVQQSNDIA